MTAVRVGNINLAKAILRRGADITRARASNGFTALHLACNMEYVDMAHALLLAGADPDQLDLVRYC